jgi:hypothetical protein
MPSIAAAEEVATMASKPRSARDGREAAPPALVSEVVPTSRRDKANLSRSSRRAL